MSLGMFFAVDPATGLRWQRAFPGCAEQARVARRFVSALLADCAFLDDVLLAVDELVVNALRHTKSGRPGGSFVLEIGLWSETVAVAVIDEGGPTEPTPGHADDLAESGRGLRVVSATAAYWGWFGNSESRTVSAVYAPPARFT